jgi:hypothetical protein
MESLATNHKINGQSTNKMLTCKPDSLDSESPVEETQERKTPETIADLTPEELQEYKRNLSLDALENIVCDGTLETIQTLTFIQTCFAMGFEGCGTDKTFQDSVLLLSNVNDAIVSIGFTESPNSKLQRWFLPTHLRVGGEQSAYPERLIKENQELKNLYKSSSDKISELQSKLINALTELQDLEGKELERDMLRGRHYRVFVEGTGLEQVPLILQKHTLEEVNRILFKLLHTISYNAQSISLSNGKLKKVLFEIGFVQDVLFRIFNADRLAKTEFSKASIAETVSALQTAKRESEQFVDFSGREAKVFTDIIKALESIEFNKKGEINNLKK